jgi:hypothetical protein
LINLIRKKKLYSEKMKKNIYVFVLMLVFCLFSFLISAQTPNWGWAKSAGGNNVDCGLNTATDNSGNVYVAGYFKSPTITFNTTTLTKTSFTEDIFVVKYDNNGNVLWAKSIGVPGNENLSFCLSTSITVDANGNCILTGNFNGSSITFDATTLINESDNLYNFFVVKYNTNGDVVWANCSKDSDDAESYSIGIDSYGNSYLTGYFTTDIISFGSIVLKGTVTEVGLHGGFFLVKYDPSGTVLWARCFGTNGGDKSFSIGVDPIGNSYICGHIQGTSLTFGSITLTTTSSYGGIFLVKFDPSGNAIWAKTAEQSGFGGAYCYDICVGDTGNALVTGVFESSTITFGATILTCITTYPFATAFFVKYDPDGNALWAKTDGIPGVTNDKVISVDSYGNSYLIDDESTNKYDSSGNLIWAVRYINGSDRSSICVDAIGNCFITGCFTWPIVYFGSIALNNVDATGNSEDFFLAKLSNSPDGIYGYYYPSCLVNIYPSPTSSKIAVEFYSDIEKGIISIFGANGQLLLNQSILYRKTELDISDYTKGIYFVKIITDKGIVLKKFIKE